MSSENNINQAKSKFISGLWWNTLEKILVKGSSFIVTVVLARILMPSDYGIIGMLAIFIALSNVFIESGFSKALIQKQDATDIDYSTTFFTNLFIAVLVYWILFFSAPLIASFYDEPLLIPITRVLFLNIIMVSLTIVQNAKLSKAVDFKSIAKINFAGVLVGGTLGILAAYKGLGVWALVIQTLATSLTKVVVFPMYSKWFPSLKYSWNSFRNLFGFGSKLLLSGSLAVTINNISTICIGKFYSVAQLGFYTRAVQFSEILSNLVYDIVGTVSYPVLSSLQSDRDELLNTYRKSLFYTALLSIPMMVLISVLARPLVIVLLTEKWLPCVLLLQILCLARMYTPLSALNLNVLNAIGRPDLMLKIELIKMAYGVVMLAVCIPIGVTAIVVGELMSTTISFFVNTYYPGKLLHYGALKMLKDWRFIILSVLIMVAVVAGFTYMVENPYIQLFGGAFIGVVTYLVCCILFKQIDLSMVKGIIKKIR